MIAMSVERLRTFGGPPLPPCGRCGLAIHPGQLYTLAKTVTTAGEHDVPLHIECKNAGTTA